MSIYEASITNSKKQLEFYKDLSEQLQRENKQLQNNWNELKEWLEEYRKNKDILVPVSIVKLEMKRIESRK